LGFDFRDGTNLTAVELVNSLSCMKSVKVESLYAINPYHRGEGIIFRHGELVTTEQFIRGTGDHRKENKNDQKIDHTDFTKQFSFFINHHNPVPPIPHSRITHPQ
jgi:hypothetical protein